MIRRFMANVWMSIFLLLMGVAQAKAESLGGWSGSNTDYECRLEYNGWTKDLIISATKSAKYGLGPKAEFFFDGGKIQGKNLETVYKGTTTRVNVELKGWVGTTIGSNEIWQIVNDRGIAKRFYFSNCSGASCRFYMHEKDEYDISVRHAFEFLKHISVGETFNLIPDYSSEPKVEFAISGTDLAVNYFERCIIGHRW